MRGMATISGNDAEDDDVLLSRLSPEVREFARNEAPEWLRNQKSLPFACTECGKCCSRQDGVVYLSQPEIFRAAAALNMDDVSFVNNYASHTLVKSNGQKWIRLKRNQDNTGCIFLDQETKHCRIYQARPIQCSAYPFYPSILESIQAWNNECRRRDDDTESTLPIWEPQSGGCEGMTPIIPGSSSHEPENNQSVPMDRVYNLLYEMVQLERDMYRQE